MHKSVGSRGFDIAYSVTGAGPEAVLFLHGFGGSADVWAPFVERLADRYRCIAVDALGHGRSSRPGDPADYMTASRASDFAKVLDAEGVARVHVWGYSMGGRNAYALATHHRDRVVDVVIGGAGPDMTGREEAWMRARAQAFLDGDRERAWRLVGGTGEMPDWFEAGNDLRVLGAVSMGLVEWACMPSALEGLPSLHYVGTDDPFHERVKLAAADSGGRFLELPGADHVTAFGRVDAIVPAVQAFWSR